MINVGDLDFIANPNTNQVMAWVPGTSWRVYCKGHRFLAIIIEAGDDVTFESKVFEDIVSLQCWLSTLGV